MARNTIKKQTTQKRKKHKFNRLKPTIMIANPVKTTSFRSEKFRRLESKLIEFSQAVPKVHVPITLCARTLEKIIMRTTGRLMYCLCCTVMIHK